MIKKEAISNLFTEALNFHKKNQLKEAEKIYSKILYLDSSHSDSLNNLGLIYFSINNIEKAETFFKKSIKYNLNNKSAYNNLGNLYQKIKKYKKAADNYSKLIDLDPKNLQAYNSLGIIFYHLQNFQKAKNCFKKIIEFDDNNYSAYYNLGKILNEEEKYEEAIKNLKKTLLINKLHSNAFNELGIAYNKLSLSENAIDSLKRSIKINPNNPYSYNNLGIVYDNIYETNKAKENFNKSIKLDPKFINAWWNLQCCSKNIDEALLILNRLNKIDKNHIKSKITTCALKGYKNDFNDFKELIKSKEQNHPHLRSVKWVFSLNKLPKLFFNKWDFFDYVISLSQKKRPFYEYGVRMGHSFKYLIKSLKKGFGFDTFTGLPEDWHESKSKGTYSSFGKIPKIIGGKFIVGKFEDTLPIFFSKKKEMASIINFDADLYSSTICALNNSKTVIDNKTILVFDEFLMNSNWEKDEFKALNDFCDNYNYSYEVLAVSFFTKQVAVKIS